MRLPLSGIGGEFSAATIVSCVLGATLVAVVLVLGVLLGGASSGKAESAAVAEATRANLRIVVWPRGKQRAARPVRWTLRCGPVGGTLPRRERACDRLLALRRPFRAVPKNTACIQIYGGPQVAEVRGSLGDRRVASKFSRSDGCQIERWNRVRFLFPASPR
jgi:hypothetical protein